MNIRRKLTLCLILFINLFFGQDIVFEGIENRILPPESDTSDGIIAYTENDDFFILNFIDGEKISICLFDNAFNQKDKVLLFKSDNGYLNFLNSYGTNEKQILIFERRGAFAGNTKRKLLAISYDFQSKNTIQQTLEINIDEERFLESFSNNDKFYILTLLNDTSVFRIHILDSNLDYQTKDVEIKKGPLFFDNNLAEFPSRPDYISKYFFNSEAFITFNTVLNNEPNDLSIITQDYKLYVKDNKLILVLDSNKDFNTLIEINLDDFSSITKQTQREFFTPKENKWAKSNSFLHNNKLFLLKGTKEKVSVNVLDLDSKSFIFKQIFDNNTPYYADRNLMISNNILKKHDIPEPKNEKDASVKKRLRKIIQPAFSVGLKVYESENNYFVTLGSYLRAVVSGQMGDGFGSGRTYSFGMESSLNFYLKKNDFNVVLDDDVEPYEKMEDFLRDFYKGSPYRNIIWYTKFKKGNDYILGYYDKEEEKYYLRKFN